MNVSATPPAVSLRAATAEAAALALFAAALFLVGLGARDLWNPNEPTYGLAVAEMASRGDWLVPTVGGRVFPEKPILYFWMALVSSRLLGGVDELSLRLPLALWGIVSVLLVRVLAGVFVTQRRARLAAALYATIFMVWWGARSVQMDFLVNVSTLAAVTAVVRVVDGDRSPWVGWSLAGLAAGLGFAAKGPVAWVLPALVVLGYLAASGRLREAAHPAIAAGAAVAVAVASPWFLLLLAEGRRELLEEVLYRQNFVRYVDAWDHRGPWWYYLKYFWIDMAPWSWFAPLAVALPGRDAGERRLDRLGWIWLASVVVFFSLSASKRSAYMLPIAPAVALIVSGPVLRMLDGLLAGWRRRAALGLLAVIGATMLSAAAFVVIRVPSNWPDLVVEGWAAVGLLTVGGSAVLVSLVSAQRDTLSPCALFGAVVGLYLLGAAVLLPAADVYKSPRSFAEQIQRTVGPERPLASYGMWVWRAGYRYYSGRSIPDLETEDELAAYWQAGGRRFLIVERPELVELRRVLGDVEPITHARVGSKTVYLFGSPGEAAGVEKPVSLD